VAPQCLDFHDCPDCHDDREKSWLDHNHHDNAEISQQAKANGCHQAFKWCFLSKGYLQCCCSCLRVNCWNHRNWNISDLLPIAPRKPFKVFPSEPTSESLIVTLNYFALFKEVLPCMFVISVPSGKHFNLRVGFIIGESGRENQTLKYIGWKYHQISVLLVKVSIKPNLAKLSIYAEDMMI